MRLKDVREIALWAVVAAIIAGGALTPRLTTAVAPTAPERPAVRVGSWEISGSVRAGDKPATALLDLTIANTGASDARVPLVLVLEQREFTGSPMSRTVSPADFKPPVTLWRQPVSAMVAKHGTWRQTIAIPVALPAKEQGRITYSVLAAIPAGNQPIASFTPELFRPAAAR